MKWRTVLSLTLPLILVGCGTMLNGRSQTIEITSEPPGARVEIDGQDFGETPIDARLRRKGPHDVRILRTGYCTHELRIQSIVSDKMFGNVLVPFLFPIFMAVDGLGGGGYELEPPEIHVELELEERETSASEDSP